MDSGLLLLDTPGILWPKFDDEEVGRRLAYTGAVKDDVLDVETLACHLAAMLWARYPEAMRARYKLDPPEDASGYDLLTEAGPPPRLPAGARRDRHGAHGACAAGGIPQL